MEAANAAKINTANEAANRGLKYSQQDVVDQQKAAQAAEHAALDEKLATHHDTLAAQQADKESAFHLPMLNRALEPLGITIPENLSGTQAMKFAQDAISEGYNKVLPTIRGIRVTGAKEKELGELLNKYNTSYLGDDLSKTFENDINRLIDTTNKGGWITAEKWQGELSELSNEAHRLLTSPGASTYDRRYGKALMDLKDNWMDLIEGKKGSEAFKNLNTAFSRLQAPQKAASYVKSITEGGEFNPQQLLQAIKSGVSTKRFAGGEDELQQLATQGHSDIMAGRTKLKADKLANEKALAEAKAKDIAELEAKHTQSGRNVEEQQRQNATIADQQKGDFARTVARAKDMENPDAYGLKRLGYSAVGLGAPTYAAHLLGISPLTTIGAGGALLAGSNAAYSDLGQKILKGAALANRPAWMKEMGATLKKNAPLGALAGVQSYQQARQKGGLPIYSGDNVTVEGAPEEPQQ